MSWWLWILIGFALLAAEFAASTLHIGLFAVGAFVVGLLVAAGVELPLWAQLVTFTGVSLVSLFFIRPWLVRKLKLNEKKIVDTLIGEQAIVLEDIAAGAAGRAEMRGSTWSARNIGETNLTRGQRCVVERVEGLVIHIKV